MYSPELLFSSENGYCLYFVWKIRREDNTRKNNIGMNLKEIKWEVVDWIHLAQDSSQWQDIMNTVTNFRVP
jgi:hypothetical protein